MGVDGGLKKWVWREGYFCCGGWCKSILRCSEFKGGRFAGSAES